MDRRVHAVCYWICSQAGRSRAPEPVRAAALSLMREEYARRADDDRARSATFATWALAIVLMVALACVVEYYHSERVEAAAAEAVDPYASVRGEDTGTVTVVREILDWENMPFDPQGIEIEGRDY